MNLLELKNKIESMNEFHQKEILKLLYEIKPICISENKNGSFINMSKLPKSAINKLIDYILYVNNQEKILNDANVKCTEIEQIFFKDNKDTATNSDNVST